MRWLFLLGALCGCSDNLTAALITKTTSPEGLVRVGIVNDSADDVSWSPCNQAWFIETPGGRERDPTRGYCNLDVQNPFGASELTLGAPSTRGTFFLELQLTRRATLVLMEVGPLEIAD